MHWFPINNSIKSAIVMISCLLFSGCDNVNLSDNINNLADNNVRKGSCLFSDIRRMDENLSSLRGIASPNMQFSVLQELLKKKISASEKIKNLENSPQGKKLSVVLTSKCSVPFLIILQYKFDAHNQLKYISTKVENPPIGLLGLNHDNLVDEELDLNKIKSLKISQLDTLQLSSSAAELLDKYFLD
jgi:hypothetical protein